MKYENLTVVTKAFGDYKMLGTVSGNTKSEILRKVKANYNFRNNGLIYIDHANGLIYIDHADFPKGLNSNNF
jgi:alpha-D-ribose 1-methylphosphonate 5-triphosphate synthase subunit PhnL